MAQKLTDKKLAVLGTGKLGGILLRAYLKQGLFSPKRVTATVKHAEKAAALAKELGVNVATENRKAVHGADIVLLGVKPQVVGEVLKEIAPELSEKTLVISVAIGADELHRAAHGRECAGSACDAEHLLESGHRDDGDLRWGTRERGGLGDGAGDV